MDLLMKKLDIYRIAFNRVQNSTTEMLDNSNSDLINLRCNLDSLTDKINVLMDLDKKVLAALLENDAEKVHIDEEIKKADDLVLIYRNLKYRIEARVSNMSMEKSSSQNVQQLIRELIPTSYNSRATKCIFCKDTNHLNSDCLEALKLPLEERKQLITEKGFCHLCVRFGHITKKCTFSLNLKCKNCGENHATSVCFYGINSNEPIVNENIEESLANSTISKTIQKESKKPTLKNVPCLEEFMENSIVTDSVSIKPFDLLLEADVVGKLTSGPKVLLRCELLEASLSTMVMLNNETNMTGLWKEHVIGIDNTETIKSNFGKEQEMWNKLIERVLHENHGKYILEMSWNTGYLTREDNFIEAKKQLGHIRLKLEKDGCHEVHNNVFWEWLTRRNIATGLNGKLKDETVIPSRGCGAMQLLKPRCSEGPRWLYKRRKKTTKVKYQRQNGRRAINNLSLNSDYSLLRLSAGQPTNAERRSRFGRIIKLPRRYSTELWII